MGNWTPWSALFGSVVGCPFLSSADPKGIFLFIFAAYLILPLFIFETAASNIKGTLDPDGAPKQTGFVPNNAFFAP